MPEKVDLLEPFFPKLLLELLCKDCWCRFLVLLMSSHLLEEMFLVSFWNDFRKGNIIILWP